MAKLVERPTEKPGAILTRARVPGAARVSFQCRLSYGIRTAPVCNGVHQHLCGHYKSQSLAAILYTIVWTYAHTAHIIGLGSPALAAAVSYPGKRPGISRMGQSRHSK